MKDNLELVNIAHHRNGSGGEPFHVVLFRDMDERMPPGTEPRPWGWSPPLMVGIVFDHPYDSETRVMSGRVAVLDVAQTMAGNIDFAKGNSWRGDNYEGALRAMIHAYEEGR